MVLTVFAYYFVHHNIVIILLCREPSAGVSRSSCWLLLLLLLRSAFGYLLVVSDTDSPGLVLFDGGTPFYDRPARRYALNPEKSGDFVAKLLRVDHFPGSVILERPLECDGFKYPDVFTFYVDSTSNDTLEYMSVPLRMVIKGCEKNSKSYLFCSRYLHTSWLHLMNLYLNLAKVSKNIGILVSLMYYLEQGSAICGPWSGNNWTTENIFFSAGFPHMVDITTLRSILALKSTLLHTYVKLNSPKSRFLRINIA